MARSLVHQPHNVLLDEPTNGLDVASSRSVRDLVRRIRDQAAVSCFQPHHVEVQALCDRIVVMGHGRVVANGTPEELRAMTGHSDLEEVFVSIAREEEKMRREESEIAVA